LFALAGAVVCALGLSLAVAAAGSVESRETTRSVDAAGARGSSVGGEGSSTGAGGSMAAGREGAGTEDSASREDVRNSPDRGEEDDEDAGDGKAPAVRGDTVHDGRRSPFLLGLGLATAARCGPELTAPEGIEAQTCVLTQGAETWARTYYRNVTGHALDAVLTLMGPADRTVQIRCAVGAGDEPASCETPREAGRGEPARYTAVAEFAERGGRGPLLLRVGSNSAPVTGS
jgi:hypothetical protein